MICTCGCGGMAKGKNKFINGHNGRVSASLRRPPIRFGVVEEEPVAFLPLTIGKEAIIDVENLEYVLMISKNWHAKKGKDYAYCRVGDRTIRLHNAILKVPDGMEVDHKNRSGLDCRRSNLRESTRLENSANRNTKTATGFHGVSVMPNGKYRARLKGWGISKSLGCFESAEEAAVAWDEEAFRVYGKFAALNFPERYR